MNEIEESGGEIICPYCQYEHTDSWESGLDNDGDTMEYECAECDKKFYVQFVVETSYNTSGLCKENNVKHNWEYFDHISKSDEKRCYGRKCLTCGKYEFNKEKSASNKEKKK